MHQKFTGLNTARRKAHDGNIIGINAVNVRVLSDKADGSCHIQRAFLLRIGRQSVIHDEGLETKLPQRCGGGERIGIIAPELICAASHQHHRAFRLHALPDGNGGDIRAEIPAVKIAGHVLRELRFSWDIAFFPEIEHLNVRRVCRCVQNGFITRRLRQLLQHGRAGIVCNFAASVVVRFGKIVRRGRGILGGTVTQIVHRFGNHRIVFVWHCHRFLNRGNTALQTAGRSLGRLLRTGSQYCACNHGNQNCCDCSFTHYSPSPAAHSRTVLLDAPEEKR